MICLNMIVKNESHIILRCLQNVDSLIDAYAIVDTGSTDNTIEIIKQYFLDKNIPGKIIEKPWVNFAHNRNEALQLGIDVVETISHRRNWYLLFMDADNLAFSDDGKSLFPFPKKLEGDAIDVNMRMDTVVYNYRWLVSLKKNWFWVGVVHEYITSGEAYTIQKLEKGYVLCGHEGDRSKDPDRYLKDALLFEKDLLEHPKNARSWYLLGQSYRDAFQWDKAERAYTKRLEFPENEEEKYLALWNIGYCRKQQERSPSEILWPWLQGFELRKHRLEIPFEIVRLYRENRFYTLAYLFGIPLMNTPLPTQEGLYYVPDIYHFLFMDELIYCSYYSGHKDAAKSLLQTVLSKKEGVPENERIRFLNNLKMIEQIEKNEKNKNFENNQNNENELLKSSLVRCHFNWSYKKEKIF